MTRLKFQFAKIYYLLTMSYPRLLPRTQEDIEVLRGLFRDHYGLEMDEPENYTFLSQLMAGDPTSLRRSYTSIVGAVKKLRLAKVVGKEKEIAQARLKAKLELLMKEEAKNASAETEVTGCSADHADVQDWTHNLQGHLPPLQITPKRVDEIPGGNGL